MFTVIRRFFMNDESIVNISINEEYLGDKRQIDIISIFGKENLEEIQKVISDVTGLAFVTVDYKGEPITEPTGFTTFCQKMRKDPNRSQLCKLSDATGTIIAATSRQSSIYFCPCGLLEVAIPIVVNGRYLGGFVGGQVRCSNAPDYVMKISKNVLSAGRDLKDVDIDSKEYEEDLKDASIYSYNEFVSISKLVELIINQLTKHEIISGYNKMENLSRIETLENKVKELEYKNAILKSRYNDLSRSANLFFSRNIFNMISNLSIIEGAKKTNDAILKYSNFITDELQNKDKSSIRDELQRVENFIDINQIRYENRIIYEVEVEEENLGNRIPFSLILPFVQALIYYGMNMSESDCFLNINIVLEKNDIKIQIRNNKVGLSINELEKKYKIYGENHEGILILKAIKNVIKAIEDIFGNEYKVLIENLEGNNNITIRYPIDFDEGI
jgi:hypothetical protein